ncbi:MAG TPA: hypothetical protein VMR21_00115 [Vicinamibacteria bacterium]|nr:hypothetical protein [Vicinamibacteria bacterium]
MNDTPTSSLVAGDVARLAPFGTDVGTNGSLRTLPDDELLHRLSALLGQSRRIEWQLVAHIGEVDQRRLYAREACDSMFVYCTDVLHLSEHEAYLRIAAARAARDHPILLAMLADGRLHLSGIAKLAPHLTPANREVLLQRATHRSKRQIEALVAELAPRPDVPASIRKLPDRSRGDVMAPSAGHADAAHPDEHALSLDPVRTTTTPNAIPGLNPSGAPSIPAAGRRPTESMSQSVAELGPDRDPATPPVPPHRRSVVEPLAPSRFRVQFTASAAFCEKLERLTELMRPKVPDGDLARILETVVTEALERREARRYGKTRSPRKTIASADTAASRDTSASPETAASPSRLDARPSRYIPAVVRRVSHARDDGRCRFVGPTGRRCGSPRWLQFHHVTAWARGGEASAGNIRVMCRIHNAYLAEKDYGKAVMARFRRARRGTGPTSQAEVTAKGNELGPDRGRA